VLRGELSSVQFYRFVIDRVTCNLQSRLVFRTFWDGL